MSPRADATPAGYAVPCYTSPGDPAWFHFLHGNVPGHEIDYIYRPELPQGALTPQHFSHLSRLITNIEPWEAGTVAFAVGNLSRDDTQHAPGHGGLALLFATRVRGARDHAGRPDPPFTHAIAAIDRSLDGAAIEAAALALRARMAEAGDSSLSANFYRRYVERAQGEPASARALIVEYVKACRGLGSPRRSGLGPAWRADGSTLPQRVLLVHADDEPFDTIANVSARIASILYRSTIRWTAITTGREAEARNGLLIRVLPERRAAAFLALEGLALRLEEVPADEEELARRLFGARRIAAERGPAAPTRTERGERRDGEATAGSAPATDKARAPASGEDDAPLTSMAPLCDERPTLAGTRAHDGALGGSEVGKDGARAAAIATRRKYWLMALVACLVVVPALFVSLGVARDVAPLGSERAAPARAERTPTSAAPAVEDPSTATSPTNGTAAPGEANGGAGSGEQRAAEPRPKTPWTSASKRPARKASTAPDRRTTQAAPKSGVFDEPLQD